MPSNVVSRSVSTSYRAPEPEFPQNCCGGDCRGNCRGNWGCWGECWGELLRRMVRRVPFLCCSSQGQFPEQFPQYSSQHPEFSLAVSPGSPVASLDLKPHYSSTISAVKGQFSSVWIDFVSSCKTRTSGSLDARNTGRNDTQDTAWPYYNSLMSSHLSCTLSCYSVLLKHPCPSPAQAV